MSKDWGCVLRCTFVCRWLSLFAGYWGLSSPCQTNYAFKWRYQLTLKMFIIIIMVIVFGEAPCASVQRNINNVNENHHFSSTSSLYSVLDCSTMLCGSGIRLISKTRAHHQNKPTESPQNSKVSSQLISLFWWYWLPPVLLLFPFWSIINLLALQSLRMFIAYPT